MNVLGINAYHADSSAALVQNGRLVAAVEEERFTRVKHWAGFPVQSIRYCLEAGGITAREIDHVAISFDPKANLGRKLLFTFRQTPELKSIFDRLKKQSKVAGMRENLATACGCSEGDLRAKFHNVEHHTAHAASSFFLSKFEKSAILSIDGMGDFVSTLTGSGEASHMDFDTRTYYPHSLGWLYNAITLYLGFPSYGDEYKVMGLAPYGQPTYVEEFRRMVIPKGDSFELNLDYFTHHRKVVAVSWENGAPRVEPFHSELLEKRLGPANAPRSPVGEREQNIAASLQKVTEEIIFHLLRKLHDKQKSDNLSLAGGVAMNSVANGKIHRETPFQNVFVPVGAADNGTSIGAAFYVWHQLLGQPRTFALEDAAWGPSFDDAACQRAVLSSEVKHRKLDEAELVESVAQAMVEGKVVGWFQGRMEFGARALGHRSLVADPRRTDMRDIINLRIKFREKFRPFAPSILEERVGDYFEDDETSVFMEKVISIRPDKRDQIPAVTHVDGTGRLQTVNREANPLYYRLIQAFERRTGIPLILNTSLNENEPIVCTPEEALQCFLRTRMDAIALGPYLVERETRATDTALDATAPPLAEHDRRVLTE